MDLKFEPLACSGFASGSMVGLIFRDTCPTTNQEVRKTMLAVDFDFLPFASSSALLFLIHQAHRFNYNQTGTPHQNPC